MKITAILLAGGIGSRFGSARPKQFLPLFHKPLILYSLELFLSLDCLDEIIVVCEERYRSQLPFPSIRFALPGKRRQDSLFNALSLATHEGILIHDAARPLIKREAILRLLAAGIEVGAATLAVPVKATIKEGSSNLVRRTLARDSLFEIQTPQFLKKSILVEGFNHLHAEERTVTDDVSLAELIGHPVTLVMGDEENIKITTPQDLKLAHFLMQDNNTICETTTP